MLSFAKEIRVTTLEVLMKLSRVVWLCLLSLPLAGYAQPISFTDAWQQVLKVSDKL
jgi:hypothetical protein